MAFHFGPSGKFDMKTGKKYGCENSGQKKSAECELLMVLHFLHRQLNDKLRAFTFG